MNRLILGLISGLSLAFTGCGDDEDDGGGNKPSAAELASGEACMEGGTGAPADCDVSSYSACVENQCSNQYEACLGAGYKSGNFSGGRCEEYFNCALDSADPCNPPDCTMPEDCLACMGELAACSMSSGCELPECAGGGGPTPMGGPSAGGGCAALMTCCSSLDGDNQSQCETVLGIDNDLACDQTLSIFQASGTCQ